MGVVPVGIALVALFTGACVIAFVQRAGRSPAAMVVVGTIMIAQLLLAKSGLLRHWERLPPPMMPVLAVSFVVTIVTALSAVGARMADRLPVVALIGFQSFRLPLELVMHRAATTGIMPVQMSFAGWNFDIVTGATAVLVAWLAWTGRAPRWLVAGWNFLGTLLLLVIIAIAVVSAPGIAAFGSDPAHLNTWVADPPYVWLPGVIVPSALLGHLVLWRKLARERMTA